MNQQGKQCSIMNIKLWLVNKQIIVIQRQRKLMWLLEFYVIIFVFVYRSHFPVSTTKRIEFRIQNQIDINYERIITSYNHHTRHSLNWSLHFCSMLNVFSLDSLYLCQIVYWIPTLHDLGPRISHHQHVSYVLKSLISTI